MSYTEQGCKTCWPSTCFAFVSGYVIYDMIHFYLHDGAPSEGSYLYTMKRYHNQHHFVHHDKGKRKHNSDDHANRSEVTFKFCHECESDKIGAMLQYKESSREIVIGKCVLIFSLLPKKSLKWHCHVLS